MGLEARIQAAWAEASEPLLHRRLCLVLRTLIEDGTTPRGQRMPATRLLAGQLGCSRNTVRQAYDQLISEGYLVSHIRGGTFAAEVLPARRFDKLATLLDPDFETALSCYGNELYMLPMSVATQRRAFWPHETDARHFPFQTMIRHFAKSWRSSREDVLRDHDPAGFAPLRRAIATFVLHQRGIVCDPADIIVCNGTAASFELIIKLLLDRNDGVWLEEANCSNAATAVHMAGGRAMVVPMDEQGIVVDQGIARAPNARMAIVSPSTCYPVGTVMSLERRQALLDWARHANALVIEDDYGCEFMFEGKPQPAIRAFDQSGRVIYIGSFSSYLFPSLRVSYVIAPPPLARRIANLRYKLEFHPPMGMQPVIASMIEDGDLATHIRRMHRIYAARRAALASAFERHLSDHFVLRLPPAGLNAIARPKAEMGPGEVRRLVQCATRHDVGLTPVSTGAETATRRPAILLGFGATDEGEIDQGARRLAAAMQELAG